MTNPLAALSTAEITKLTAAKQPTPGGGSICALIAAHAISLLEMVYSYSVQRKAVAEHKEVLARSAAQLAELRQQALNLADKDTAAYGLLNQLSKQTNADPDEVRNASIASTEVPLQLCDLCNHASTLATSNADHLNPYLRSDLLIASDLLASACRSCEYLILANRSQLESLNAWTTQAVRAADARQSAESNIKTLRSTNA